MSEITVASTTDTQQAVELAAGVNDEGTQAEESQPQSEAGSQQHVDSTDEAESATDKEAATDTTDEAEEQQIPRSARNDKDKGWTDKREESSSRRQKQFDTLTQRIYEQQQELDELKERFNNTGEGAGATRASNDGRPIPAQYRSYDEYVEALAGWKAGQRLQQQKQAELVQAEQERTREVFHTYNEAAQSARTKYEDFEEVVGRRDLKIPQAAQVAIIEAGEAGPDIAYYLGKHPEMCKELARMSPMRAIARIGQIEGQVAGYRGQGTGKTSNSSQPRAAHGTPGSSTVPHNTTRTTTSAPAPITPVGGSSTRSSVPLGELSYRDYKRVRDQEERRGR